MARSRRKTPIHGSVRARSESWDKRQAHSRLRMASKEAIMSGLDIMPEIREVSNVWSMAKDGKRYFSKERFPEMMRK